MDLTQIETMARGAGGLLTAAVLGAIFLGIWRGAGRATGQKVGRFPGLLHSPLFYLATSAAYFGVCLWLWQPLPLRLGQAGRAAALIIGSLLFFPGMGAVLWARLALGRMYFVSTGFGAQLFADHRLVTHGPFALVRHPMYAGIATAALGGLLLYQTWTLAATLLLPFALVRRARREEQALAAQFGQEWRDYSRRVPAFIPRLTHGARAASVQSFAKEAVMDTPTVNLTGVAQTLLVPLACRALESARPDAIIHDPRAEAVFHALGGGPHFLLGMSGHDLFAAVMRVRQFDAFAQDFLARQPKALVVDLGCGLDTRFYRLDDGRLAWLGVDLPEVIALRRQWLPDEARCRTFAASIFDLTWLAAVDPGRPVIFLAEGVFPYFSTGEVKPLLTALAARFPGAELVFDALSPLMAWVHNQTSSVLKQSNTRVRWDARDPQELETWGLRLLDRWGYFDRPEPRLGAAGLIRFIPPLARATYILRYRLEGPAAP